jgi:hypothetical protein
VAVPGGRGKLREQGLPAGTAPAAGNTGKPIRIGYARCPAARQELQSQPGARERAGCKRIFSEKIRTRIKVRAELEKALKLAHEITEAAPGQPVILTGCELKCHARSAAELMPLSAAGQAVDIQPGLLTGPLTGVHDPGSVGSMLFAVLAVAARPGRNHIREKTLEGQVIAAGKGNHGGRPKVTDDDMLVFGRALKDKGVPVPEIARKLVSKTGGNAGKHPSVASLYRALAEAGEAEVIPRPARAPVPATGGSHDRERLRS